MRKMLSCAAIAATMFSGNVSADRDPSRQPIDQGIASVSKNLARDPDNRGLRNALVHLFENQIRQSARREDGPGSQRVERGERVERVERVERIERPERPERVERVEVATRLEIARAHRPDRPDRPQRNGRK